MALLHSPLSAIDQQIESYCRSDLRLVVSSSFQTHSIPLLHILHTLMPEIPVVFLDTGYHFPETIAFRDKVAHLLDLNLLVVGGHESPRSSGLYITSENLCCATNKVDPMHALLADFDVWITGVRGDQTPTRGELSSTMDGPAGTERYHPMLDWSVRDIDAYRKEFDLPAHPLDALGYRSIGCAPCTDLARPSTSLDTDRTGRWKSTGKTECGLHLTGVSR